MDRNSEWSFDEVDELCRRAFAEGVAHGASTNPYSRGDDQAAWENSKVAAELADMCS